MNSIAKIVSRGAAQFGIALPAAAADMFEKYAQYLDDRAKLVNLTAISGPDGVANLHFIDSLALLTLCPFAGASVIDIGSGAGFPGLPLRIAMPDIKLTLLDAQQKRVNFLAELCEKLELYDVQCIQARAEECSKTPEMREMYDYAVSRAVARLNVLCELCLPFVKPSGAFLAMKSVDSDEEIREGEEAIKLLGGVLEKVADYEIPGVHIMHRAVIIRKISETPKNYPRRFARIEKAPIVSRETPE